MAAQIEEPKGKALDDLRRQRAEREQMKKEAAAPTTKTEMGKFFKKGGAIMKKKHFSDGGEVPAEDRGSLSGGLPPISRDKFEAGEDTGPVTGRLHKGRSKTKSGGFTFDKRGFKNGGSVGSASRRADGIASKGKTKGRFV